MWDCRTSAGHFFVHTPQIRTFVCQRCRKVLNHYNPPQPRSNSKSTLHLQLVLIPDQPKAPWRCILENCAYTLCFPCVEHVNSELIKIRALKEEADNLGNTYDIETVVKQAEVCEGAPEERPPMTWRRPGTIRPRAGSLSGGGEAPGIMEVDTGPIEVDDGSDGEYNMDDLALPRLSYRSAMMAAAASVRAQSDSRRRVPQNRQDRLSMESQKPAKVPKISIEDRPIAKELVNPLPASNIVRDDVAIEVDSDSSEGEEYKYEIPRILYRSADIAAARSSSAGRVLKRPHAGAMRTGERRQ